MSNNTATKSKEIQARRERLFGQKTPLFYEDPLHIVRGEGVWLYAADGSRYLDCYNNVPHVGHCNPTVVEAMTRQAATLNTHTRYLHETILDYGERLTATLDDSISMVIFVCTGSEANDQALRIARLHTGGQGVICTNLTYHGNTTAVAEISPHGEESDSTSVRTIPFPDSYRPLDGLQGEALSDAYVSKIRAAITSFEESGVGFAGMIVCPIFANEGLPNLPPNFMQKAVDAVHDAGGLFIADEVQAGFGRTGKMWGHEVAGIVPDIVTMGKPMGNGFPLGALAASAELIQGFRDRVMYFNTFGGNPIAGAVGNAVLDVMERDHLIDNARTTGAYLRKGLAELAQRHPMISEIRGHGFWVGIELVRDQDTKEPADTETRDIVNRMKERGILINRIGEFDNVLKLRPPMPFAPEHADLVLENLDAVLGNR
jgi:4-aminobutyrate aminotransferase-like enzyme